MIRLNFSETILPHAAPERRVEIREVSQEERVAWTAAAADALPADDTSGEGAASIRLVCKDRSPLSLKLFRRRKSLAIAFMAKDGLKIVAIAASLPGQNGAEDVTVVKLLQNAECIPMDAKYYNKILAVDRPSLNIIYANVETHVEQDVAMASLGLSISAMAAPGDNPSAQPYSG